LRTRHTFLRVSPTGTCSPSESVTCSMKRAICFTGLPKFVLGCEAWQGTARGPGTFACFLKCFMNQSCWRMISGTTSGRAAVGVGDAAPSGCCGGADLANTVSLRGSGMQSASTRSSSVTRVMRSCSSSSYLQTRSPTPYMATSFSYKAAKPFDSLISNLKRRLSPVRSDLKVLVVGTEKKVVMVREEAASRGEASLSCRVAQKLLWCRRGGWVFRPVLCALA